MLPFAASAASLDAEYLADGITETLINRLAQFPDLRVIARNTVFRHKNTEIDVQEIGRALSVESIVTGRVNQRGKVLVVGAELANVSSRAQLSGISSGGKSRTSSLSRTRYIAA